MKTNLLFYLKKQLNKDDQPNNKKKPLRFVKIFVFLLAVFLKYCMKSYLLPYFLSKNN